MTGYGNSAHDKPDNKSGHQTISTFLSGHLPDCSDNLS